MLKDHEIADLISLGRFILREHKDWDLKCYTQYIRLKRLIQEQLRQRRKHRKNESRIWRAFTESCLAKRQNRPVMMVAHMTDSEWDCHINTYREPLC